MKELPITGDLLPALPDGPAPGAPVQLPTVEITGAKEALVIRPGDRLVMVMPEYTDRATMEWFRDQCRAAGLGQDQIVIVGGVERVVKIEAPDGTAS